MGFDVDKLVNDIKNDILNSPFETECPNCHTKVSVSLGENLCPSCGAKITVDKGDGWD